MDDPGLPIKLGTCSNGEFPPIPPSDVVREALRRARRMCEDNARRLGMDRRRFLLSSMGAATTLLALGACSDESKKASGNDENGGRFNVDDEAMVDAETALDALGSDQPVVDMQTHLLEYPTEYDGYHLGQMWLPFRDCGEHSVEECFTTERWTEEIFTRSDTTLAVLSALPAIPGTDVDPLSAEVMDGARRALDELCGDGRVLVQGHAWVNVGEPQDALDAMDRELENYPNLSAWKVYTSVGPGFSLDDHMGEPIGEGFLNKVEEIGPPIVCVHKGLGSVGDPVFTDPADIGPAARNHPDLTFCVYHSAFEPGVVEGPYDPAAPNGGVDRLVKTLEDNNIEPGSNVYSELGATWWIVMRNPDTAAHVLGKLLNAVGEDRILWGTDSIWFGTPHDQIQAFRAFEITEEFQEQYGYPALTDEIKHKILWRNAATLLDIDVARLPCRDPQEAEAQRMESPRRNMTYGPRTAAAQRALFRSAHPWAFPT